MACQNDAWCLWFYESLASLYMAWWFRFCKIDFLMPVLGIAPWPPPLPHQPSCAEQSPPSPVEEGLDFYLPYQKHIWRLASIKCPLEPWTLAPSRHGCPHRQMVRPPCMPPSPPLPQACYARTPHPTTTWMASYHHVANSSPTCHERSREPSAPSRTPAPS